MTVSHLLVLACVAAQDLPQALDDEHTASGRRREETETEIPIGNWLGLRRVLEDRGLRIDAFATSDFSRVLSGGVDSGSSSFRTLFDVTIGAETERLFGHDGGELFLDLQLERGSDGSRHVGDLQAFSNIDAPDFTQVSELWAEQTFMDGVAAVRGGRIDANGQFAWVEYGQRFIHSSMGFSPTVVGLPTYPDARLGAVLTTDLGEGLELLGGVFDAASSGSFLIAQVDGSWETGRLALGAWRHTGHLQRFDGGTQSGTGGVYMTLDQLAHRSILTADDTVGVFLQLGTANAAVSPIEAHFGLGAVWEGLGPGGKDALGFGMSRAALSNVPAAGFGTDAETAWEIFYSFGFRSWLRLKPDLQFITDPGGDPTLDNAWVFTLRTSVSF